MRERNHQLTREVLTASEDLAGEVAAVVESVRAQSAFIKAGDSHPKTYKLTSCTPAPASPASVPRKLRIASWNVGTMSGRSTEVVEAITRRNVDICSVQEVRYKGHGTRWINGRNSRAKFMYQGSVDGFGGVGIIIQDMWKDNVIEVKRVSSRIMYVKLSIDKCIVTILSIYAPQSGRSVTEKTQFYDELQSVMANFEPKEIVFACGDWNGHIGEKAQGFEKIHGGFAFGKRNTDGERILEFADANEMAICNSFFRKGRQSHLVTYCHGENGSTQTKTQVDYILIKQRDRKLVTNTKVIPGEECVTQHKLLVCDTVIEVPKLPKPVHIPKLRVWKLKEPACRQRFLDCIWSSSLKDSDQSSNPVEESWVLFRDTILQAVETSCGWTKPRRDGARETWWWNDTVDKAVTEKREKWRVWKAGGPKAGYNRAKKMARLAVYTAQNDSENLRRKNS